MKLKLLDWMYLHNVNPGLLRRKLGIRNRSTLNRILAGERRPSPALIKQIETLTKGAVTREELLDPTLAKCARLVRRPDGTSRIIHPWSPDAARVEPSFSDRLSPPLLKAIEVLDGRGWFTPSGKFLLDGRISDPKRIVAAANKKLRDRGEPPIPYPGVGPLP